MVLNAEPHNSNANAAGPAFSRDDRLHDCSSWVCSVNRSGLATRLCEAPLTPQQRARFLAITVLPASDL
jgi:hypothetical protein